MSAPTRVGPIAYVFEAFLAHVGWAESGYRPVSSDSIHGACNLEACRMYEHIADGRGELLTAQERRALDSYRPGTPARRRRKGKGPE